MRASPIGPASGRPTSRPRKSTAAGPTALLGGVDGILVPGGFGMRGIEGKIEAIRYARTRNIPFFGICLGMQCAVVEFARNVLGLEDANSTEFDKTTEHPVICADGRTTTVRERGGTMRLGSWPCSLAPDSLARQAYGVDRSTNGTGIATSSTTPIASVRGARLHRHRHQPDGTLVEIIERPDHPWFLAVQFHPEFKSKPTKAHPLFRDFIAAASATRRQSTGRSRVGSSTVVENDLTDRCEARSTRMKLPSTASTLVESRRDRAGNPLIGRIRAMAEIGGQPELTDANGPGDDWVAPAFWDIQFNGRWGHSFSSPDLTVEQVVAIVRAPGDRWGQPGSVRP